MSIGWLLVFWAHCKPVVSCRVERQFLLVSAGFSHMANCGLVSWFSHMPNSGLFQLRFFSGLPSICFSHTCLSHSFRSIGWLCSHGDLKRGKTGHMKKQCFFKPLFISILLLSHWPKQVM